MHCAAIAVIAEIHMLSVEFGRLGKSENGLHAAT